MIKTNLHAHTWRCNHATGTEREYIEAAIEAGYERFGFSDHTPYPFPAGYYSTFRMQLSQMKGYVSTLLDLKEEYKDRIDLKIGYEVEYYPKHFKELIKILSSCPVDYIILGQHALQNEYDGEFSGTPSGDVNKLRRYVDQVCEAMDTGLFTYFAHPDMLNFTGPGIAFNKEFSRLIEHAKKCGLPLEINLLGLKEGREYPNERFFALCGRLGAKVCIGTDTHHTEDVYRPEVLKKAMDMVGRYGLEVVESPVLKPVRL